MFKQLFQCFKRPLIISICFCICPPIFAKSMSQRRYENFYELQREKRKARKDLKVDIKAHKSRRKLMYQKRVQAILEQRRRRKAEFKKRVSDRAWRKLQKEKEKIKEKNRQDYLKKRRRKKSRLYQIPPMEELDL